MNQKEERIFLSWMSTYCPGDMFDMFERNFICGSAIEAREKRLRDCVEKFEPIYKRIKKGEWGFSMNQRANMEVFEAARDLVKKDSM